MSQSATKITGRFFGSDSFPLESDSEERKAVANSLGSEVVPFAIKKAAKSTIAEKIKLEVAKNDVTRVLCWRLKIRAEGGQALLGRQAGHTGERVSGVCESSRAASERSQ